MSRVVRNKNEENRPSNSGGDSVTVKKYFLIDKRKVRTQIFQKNDYEKNYVFR